MARPDKSQARRRVEWQVAAEALTFQGEVPSYQGQVGAEQNPRIGALQAAIKVEHRVNLLAESWLIQVSFLKTPTESPPLPFNSHQRAKPAKAVHPRTQIHRI